MLSWKKMAKYTLASGLALGLVFSTGVRAMAAEDAVKGAITTDSYKMDYSHNVLRITVLEEKNVPAAKKKDDLFADGEPKYVYVGVGKTETAIKAYDRFEVKCEVTDNSTKDAPTPTEYSYDYYVEVDLPTYVSPTVKYIVKAYSSNQAVADAKTYTIATQTKKLEVKYVPKDAALTVKADGTDLKAADGTYEIKTLYGDWIDSTKVGAEKYESYAVYGATLVVREKATTEKPASKEVKVKIPKKANGPKATINPTSLTVSIPNNAVWRVMGDTQRDDTGFEGSYIWTESNKNKDGWITNSTKGAQSLEILQTAVSEAKATIGKTPVPNPNFKEDDSEGTYADRTKYGRYILKTDKTKATDTLEDAAMEDITPDVLSNGAVLELKTVATAKKAESKISYFDIPAQNPAVEYGTDFTVTYEPDRKGEKVANVEFKNLTGVKLQIAIADSNYDITKVKFATVDKNAAKKYGATTAKDGKVLLVRTASVAANARTNTVMELGGKETVYPIVHPKQAGSLSNYKFTKKDGTEGASTLSIPTPAAGKKYAYEKVTEKVEKLKVCATLPESAAEIKKTNNVVSEELTGLKTGSLVVVYEYNESDELVTAFVCYELKADDIGTAAQPTTVTLGEGSVQGITAGDKKITGLTAGGKYVVQIGEKYRPVLTDGTLGSEFAAKSDAEAAAVELTGTEITDLINGTTYIVTEVAAIGG